MAMVLNLQKVLGRSTYLAPLRLMNTVFKGYRDVNDPKGLFNPEGLKNKFAPSTNGKKRAYAVLEGMTAYGGIKGLEKIGKYFIKEAYKKKLSWQKTLDGNKLSVQVDVWRFDKHNLKIEVENGSLLITGKGTDLLGEEVKLDAKIPFKENVDEKEGIAEYRHGLLNVIFPRKKM